jgi:membrane protease YdiL (CAAX protease family)
METYAWGAARRHPVVTTVVGAVVAVVLVGAVLQADFGRAVVYLAVLALSVLLTDFVLDRRGVRAAPALQIRGVRIELAVLSVSFLGGLGWLTARFVSNYRPAPGLLRIAWLGLLIAGVFNALPALVLLARRYRPTDLGLGWRGLGTTPLIIIVFASAATVFFPGATTWNAIVAESGGSPWTVVETALLAAVPEEFFRFAWQTRLGSALRQPATGWLAASLLWALLHGPKDWDETHSVRLTLIGMADIVPLGLVWGYLTHRTGSFLPAVVLHATNVWGLQNL